MLLILDAHLYFVLVVLATGIGAVEECFFNPQLKGTKSVSVSQRVYVGRKDRAWFTKWMLIDIRIRYRKLRIKHILIFVSCLESLKN